MCRRRVLASVVLVVVAGGEVTPAPLSRDVERFVPDHGVDSLLDRAVPRHDLGQPIMVRGFHVQRLESRTIEHGRRLSDENALLLQFSTVGWCARENPFVENSI